LGRGQIAIHYCVAPKIVTDVGSFAVDAIGEGKVVGRKLAFVVGETMVFPLSLFGGEE
jgi:hypothetical protein